MSRSPLVCGSSETHDAGRCRIPRGGCGSAADSAAPAARRRPDVRCSMWCGSADRPRGRSARRICQRTIARDFESARRAAETSSAPIVTLEGEVFRGARVVEGGSARRGSRHPDDAARNQRTARASRAEDGDCRRAAADEIASLDVSIATAESRSCRCRVNCTVWKSPVSDSSCSWLTRTEAIERIRRKQDQIATERRSAEEELRAQDARHEEARESIARIQDEQRTADDLLNSAQRRLFEAREAMQAQAERTSEAKATHERSSSVRVRLRWKCSASKNLPASWRAGSRRAATICSARKQRRSGLAESIGASESKLDAGLHSFDELRDRVRTADEASQSLRAAFEGLEGRIREARRSLETVRANAAQLEVTRATAESDLGAPGLFLRRIGPGLARRGGCGGRGARKAGPSRGSQAGGRCPRRRGDRRRGRGGRRTHRAGIRARGKPRHDSG